MKGTFVLKADSEQFCLSENVLDTRVNLAMHDSTEEGTSLELHHFFNEIKEAGKLKVLLEPSDVVFNDIAKRELKLDKKHFRKVFNYLSDVYEQEELDKRMIAKDLSFLTDFRHSDLEVLIQRILDIYVVFDNKTNTLTFYDKNDSDKAKQDYLNLSCLRHQELTKEMLGEMK